MDISKLDTRKGAEQGFDLRIIDPNGNKTDIVITIRGADSQTYEEKLREIRRRSGQNFNKTRQLVRSPQDLDAEEIELLVSATIGWKGIELGGAAFSFSEANAQRLYTDYPAIKEQVDRAINDRSNFLPKAATPL